MPDWHYNNTYNDFTYNDFTDNDNTYTRKMGYINYNDIP
jgi:hypothetical protein